MKVIVDILAAVHQTPRGKRVDFAKGLGLSPSTVNTAVGKKKAVEANTLIFDSKTKEVRGAKHADLGAEVFLGFEQPRSCMGDAVNVFLFEEKCDTLEQFLQR